MFAGDDSEQQITGKAVGARTCPDEDGSIENNPHWWGA
jgi:hypothetical protein